MIKNMMNNIRLGINTIKSEDFKKAWKDAKDELKELNRHERRDLIDLWHAYMKQKEAYKRSYDVERKITLVSLFTRVAAAYKAERFKDMLRKEQVETIYD